MLAMMKKLLKSYAGLLLVKELAHHSLFFLQVKKLLLSRESAVQVVEDERG
jgi:hypothetical protein